MLLIFPLWLVHFVNCLGSLCLTQNLETYLLYFLLEGLTLVMGRMELLAIKMGKTMDNGLLRGWGKMESTVLDM